MRPKRRHPRINDQIPVQLARHRGGACFARAPTRQLSRGGCMVTGHHGIPRGSIVDVTFYVGGRFISITAMVIYEVEYDGENLTGLRFISVAPRDLAALEEYIGRKIEISGADADPPPEKLPA